MSTETLTIQTIASAGAEVELLPRRRLSEMQRSRPIRAKFDAAQTTEENRRHWANADTLGPNAALNPVVRRIVRDRARYEFANNAYCYGIVRTHAMYVVGTGPMLQCSSGISPQVDAEIESLFWDWMIATRTPDKLLTGMVTKSIGGEWFSSFFRNPNLPNPIHLDHQPHEPEMVANPRTGFVDDPRDGIIVDDFGNPLAYMLLREHPGEGVYTNLTGTADFVPARDMMHIFTCNRPGQSRGVSDMVSVLPLFALMRRYTLAVARAAETAADVAAVMHSMMNPSNESEDIEPFDSLEMDRGMIMTLPKGWDVSQIKAEQPANTFEMWKREMTAEVARPLCMPYNIAAGDSSRSNYSSARLDFRNYAKAIRVERFMLETQVLDRLFARWWEFAVFTEDYLPAEAMELERAPSHEWRWDGDEYIDPQKEANAADTRVKSGTSHRAAEYAAQGKDYNVEDQKAADSYGVTVEEYRKRLLDAHFPAPKATAAPADSEEEMEDADV